ncbi:DUF4260 family protein [Lysinimonas soli]|uniref:DUF4260 family protein n=1 Tax=Lysinimonas soli TaxID=1074233 RepID=A0ABW0NLI2_9MICO
MTNAALRNTSPHGRSEPPKRPVTLLERLEGGAIAAASVVLFLLLGFAWWWLLALFILFDLSMVGFVAGNRVGAIVYNSVHNYAVPAVLLALYGLLLLFGLTMWPLAFVAGCWFFHVAADRALGQGPRPLA